MEEKELTLHDFRSIKTYEDACTVLGVKPIDEEELRKMSIRSHIIALIKLETISRALWGLDFEPVPKAEWDGTYYWWIWWAYYTQGEIDRIRADKDLSKPAALFGGHALYGSNAGFGYLGTSIRPSYTDANIGFRLCQETEEKASYFATQFADLWVAYLAYDFCVTERII